MFEWTQCSLPALSYKDSTFASWCFYLLLAWITASFGFSCIFTNAPLSPFLMLSNLAGSPILGSHPLSLSSLHTWLYCLLVSGGAERAESRQIFLFLWWMTCLFALNTWDFLFILEFSNFISSVSQSWQLSVGFFWFAVNIRYWHLGLTAFLISLFVLFFNTLSQYWLSSLSFTFIFPSIAVISLSFFLLCDFFLTSYPSVSLIPFFIVVVLDLDACNVAFISVTVLFFVCFFP